MSSIKQQVSEKLGLEEQRKAHPLLDFMLRAERRIENELRVAAAEPKALESEWRERQRGINGVVIAKGMADVLRSDAIGELRAAVTYDKGTRYERTINLRRNVNPDGSIGGWREIGVMSGGIKGAKLDGDAVVAWRADARVYHREHTRDAAGYIALGAGGVSALAAPSAFLVNALGGANANDLVIAGGELAVASTLGVIFVGILASGVKGAIKERKEFKENIEYL